MRTFNFLLRLKNNLCHGRTCGAPTVNKKNASRLIAQKIFICNYQQENTPRQILDAYTVKAHRKDETH